MKEIHILHLMPKLLSLYGEYGNVAVLKKVLTDKGYPVTVDHWESGPLNLRQYDLIYMGSGTEDNLAEAVRRLSGHAAQIRESIHADTCWLATGNALSVFCRGTLDVLPCDCVTDTSVRHMGDVLTEDCFGAPLVGYINTSCRFSGIETPLVQLRFGQKLGNGKDNATAEGIHFRNFFGTQLIGPVLVKNPHFLAAVASQITGDAITIDPDSNLCKAYEITLQELRKRAGIE